MSGRKSMSADTTRYLDLLEQRIVLLGSLADALVSAGPAFPRSTLTGSRLASPRSSNYARKLARSIRKSIPYNATAPNA